MFKPGMPRNADSTNPFTCSLAQDLVSRFSATDPKANTGVLEVAHSIFNRWRPLKQTDELYIEINHVLETFGQSFFQLLVVCKPWPPPVMHI